MTALPPASVGSYLQRIALLLTHIAICDAEPLLGRPVASVYGPRQCGSTLLQTAIRWFAFHNLLSGIRNRPSRYGWPVVLLRLASVMGSVSNASHSLLNREAKVVEVGCYGS